MMSGFEVAIAHVAGPAAQTKSMMGKQESEREQHKGAPSIGQQALWRAKAPPVLSVTSQKGSALIGGWV